MLGARTWYPAADERNGSYQLQKAEERANQEHAENLMRIERLRESRLRRELSRVGGAHSVFPLAIGAFPHHPSCSASGGVTRAAPCAIHGTNPMKSSHPPQGIMPKQSQSMKGPNGTGFQQGNKQQMSSPQNNMHKTGQQNNMQTMGQQNNMQTMGQQNNMQKMGQQSNMQNMGQKNNMQSTGQQNNMQKMGQQNNMQKMGQQSTMQQMGQHNNMPKMTQQNNIQKSGNSQQMSFQQPSMQKSGSSPKNMQQSNPHQMSYQQDGGHSGIQQGNKQLMGHQTMQKGDNLEMRFQNPMSENTMQDGHKQKSGFDQSWSDGQKHNSPNGSQSFSKDTNFMQPTQLKRSYSDSHQKVRHYPSSARLSIGSVHDQRGGDNGRSLYSGLLDYDFHCDYHDRILLNEINRAMMLPKLDEDYSGGRRRSSSFVF